ncbi:hypothetical protein AB0I77_43265 [Streptomyces sp. NPDC050619]|uniref:hypothetical protein n=1 Tax=Streptomyces sp. NPDC050619 TaxID=3157214 RepID=UPI00343C3589
MGDTPNEVTEQVAFVDAEDVAFAREIAELHDVEMIEPATSGIEPVSIVAVSLLGGVLAVNTVSRLLDARRGGQLIDLRPGAVQAVGRSRDVLPGLIIVLAVDGTVTVHCQESRGDVSAVIDCLSVLAGGDASTTMAAVESAVRGSVSSGVEISTQDPGRGVA